jgi:hypothetical protein
MCFAAVGAISPRATWRRIAWGRSWTRDHFRMKETVTPSPARAAAAL